MSKLHNGFDERARGRVPRQVRAGFHRPLRAPQGGVARCRCLAAPEVGQQIVETPADRSLGYPRVIAVAVAAQVAHRVDAARAAQHLSAGVRESASIESVLADGFESPISLAANECRPHGGNTDGVGPPARTGLEEQHPHVGVLTEARGNHAACGACSYHDVVVRIHDLEGRRAKTLRVATVRSTRDGKRTVQIARTINRVRSPHR